MFHSNHDIDYGRIAQNKVKEKFEIAFEMKLLEIKKPSDDEFQPLLDSTFKEVVEATMEEIMMFAGTGKFFIFYYFSGKKLISEEVIETISNALKDDNLKTQIIKISLLVIFF